MANEAKIGNTEYATLKEAFAAAKKGDTITLLTNITLTEQIDVTDQDVLSGITLDGDGHTITCATTDDPSQSGGSALYFGNANAGKWATGVSIKNLNMEGKARFAIFLCGGTTSNFENVNISGEYYIAINLYGTHGATFKDCNISNSFDGAYYDATVWTNVAAQNPIILENSTIDKITINGYTEANTLAPKIFVDKNSSATVISLDDGTVSKNKILGVSQSSEGNVTIKTLDDDTYVENYVAEVSGVKYGTIGAALAAAQDGDTITLLSDISLDQTLTIDKTVTIESAAGSAFTIKAGPSMTATKFNSMALLNIKNAGVSLKNLTLDGNGQSGMTLIWTNQATGLTLDTCTLKNSRNAIYAGSYNGGTVKINNCSIIAQIYAINGSGMDKIEVTDSKIYGWTSFNSAKADAEALFRNCFFGAGDDTGKNGLVAALRPYFNAVIEGCTFTEAFSKFTEGYYEENGLSLGTANEVMDLTNCKIVTETGDPSTLALAKLISTKYDAAAGNAKPNTAFAFDAVKDENGKYISGIFCGDSEVITKNLAAGLAAVANEDGTYTPTAVDMSTLLVNEKWAETYKVGDLIQEGFYFGVNAFAKANDAINAAGANATIKIQDARDYNTPITRVSYTENLTIEAQEDDYSHSQLYMTVSGKTYTYGEEDENGNAVRHDATVEYKGQDIFFGGHSHFESLAGMTVKFTSTEVTHEGGTPFFKVYGDSNVVFDRANYANDNGNLWFYVSGQLDLLNDSTLETEGGSGFRILVAGGKVNVDNRAFLRVLGSNISIGSYYVYSDKTAKAVVGGKKQGHDADGSNDYSATLNITNRSGLVNVNGIVRVGASYILDNATTDELEGLTITDNPNKPANYADLVKACLNITDASAAELDRLYVDGNGAVTIRNSTLTANSITLADGSSLTLDTAATVTVGALAAADGTITIDASSYTDGLYKLINVTENAKVDYSKILTAFGENLTVIDNDLWIGAVDRSTFLVDSSFAGKYNVGDPIEGLEGFFYGFNAFASAENMFDNIHDTTTTLKFFGEQELVTDATTGAANNRNFNIRAKQDLTLTADEAAKLTLTVKDSTWTHGGSTNNVGELAFLSDSDDAVQTITIGENVTIDTNAKIWFGRTAVTKEVHATNVIINGSIIQKPHKDATSEHPNASLYGIHQIQVEKGSTVTLNGSMLFGWSLLVKGGTFNVTENASLTWDVDAFAQTNGNVEVESRQETGGQFKVSGSKNVNLRSLTIKDGASSASFTNGAEAIFIDYITLADGSSITVDAASTVTTGTLTNNGELVIYESTLKAMTITNNNYFAINKNSAITAEFSAAGTGFITVQDAAFGADTVINSTASYTNQGIGSEILMFGTNILANGANISTGWSKDLRIGFGANFPSASISITSGAKLNVGGNTYIGSALEDQSDAAYTVFVTGAGSEFNGSGASGDLYLRADGMLTIQNGASTSFSYFNGKGVLNVLNATFKSLNFNIADSGKLTFVNGAKATLGNTATASTARGDISVKGDKTELNLIGDIKYGRTNTAADFTVKSNAAVTVDGNIELGYFTQTSGVMAFYKGSLSLTDNAKFTTTGTITVFLDSAIAMDHTSRLTFGGLSAQSGSITIAVSGYTDGIYKVMENTGANAVDYATVISNWSEIENIGYTILDNSLYIGKADAENYLVNEAYSKYKFGDAIEGKTGYFYGFNAFSSLDEAGRAVKEATRTITVEADLTEDVNTPLFDLKGDLILTAEAPVTVTWNVIGNAADAPDTDGKVYLVSKDGLNHTFTIGKNVTLNVPQSNWGGAFYVGYQSAWATKLNIDGKVNTYLFYIGAKSEVTISETGSLTTTSENLIMRWDSKLTVNGNGTLDENNPQVKLSYASIQGGDLVLNNTVMNAGSWLEMWNRNKVDGKQAPALTMDNSVLIAGGLTANDAEEAVISLNNNSTVKINGNATNAGTMSVTDSVLYVDETLTNSGTINVYGESSIKTTYVSNTGMIILNDGTTLIDSTIMDSTENTVAYGNVTVRNSHFGTLVFSGNSGASVNGTLEGAVYVDDLMVDRRYNNAVSEDITGTLTVKADANIGVSKHMYNKVGSTTVIEANATVTVIGELQNKGTINVEGFLYLFSENDLGESVAGRDKNKGVMNVNGGNVYYADGSSSNGWFGIGAKIHNAGWEDVQEAGSEMNLSNNALLDLTFNGGNEYPGKYGAAFAIGTGATLNVESGSTVKANSALLNKGTVNLDGTSSITVGDLINEATGKINVKAGKNVSFKAGALTNNGEFAVDGGSYQGGTVKVIDLDSIAGAEIIVKNIDSKYVYRGDDGDVLFSDASKEILKGNTSWSSIAFGDAVTEAGTDFYKGVNAFDNGTGLWAQFEENVTTEVEIGAGDFTDGNVTSASHRFIGGKNVVIRSTAAGDDYAVLSKDSTFEYGVADEATIDADYTITLEGNQQYDWLQVRAAQKDWQTGSTEAGKQIKLNADGTAQAPDHLITLNVNGKVIAKTLNVKEGTLINIDASKGGSLTGNGNGGGGYVVRGMMNVIGKNGTDFDSEATLNLNGAAFTVGYAPNSSKVRGPAFVNITDKAVVTNIMHSFLNFQAPGSILNVDNAKLDVGHIQEATAGNASCDFTFNVKNKADVHAKNSIVLGQDAQNGDDGIFSFNVENSAVAADWNIELKTFSDTTLSTSKMSAAKDFILNGNLSMQNVSTLTVGGNFTNTGSISVGSGSSLDVGNTFINRNNFNLNWNASLKMGSFDATSSSITIDMTGFDNKEHALVVVNNTTLDETAVISIVGQNFYDKYKGYLRYDGNTLYLTENLSAEVYVSSGWAGKGQGETVDYNGNTYTIGTNAFGTVEEAKAVNPLLIHIVDGTISKTALEAVKTVLEGDATYTGVITAGTRVNDGVDNRRTVDGDTNVTVNGGTFRSHLIGADSQISGSIRRNGNVTLTINGGDFEKQVAGGMYFYAQNPFDEAVLNGDVNMTINGGTFVKRVYGGCFTQLENEYTAQTKIVGDINLTIDASVNTITFNNMVTAGSRGTGRIYGDINVKVTGAGSNLNFTTKLIGDSNAAGYYNTASGYTEQTYVSGDRIVEFANFQGDFNAELIMFKTLNFSEGTNMTFTSVRLDVSNVSEWNFGFGTELNINAGLNSFEGDELAFGLDGWDNSSDWIAINGAKDSMIAGWDKAGSVSFILNGSEYAASWDAAAGAWCNSELGVKLGLGDDQKSLLISKLA